MSKKILLICAETMNVVNFRSELITYLIKNGYTVSIICSDNERMDEIKKLGVTDIRVAPFTIRDTNPFALKKLQKTFIDIIKEINPDIVFTFQSKPNIAGATAAYKAGVKNIITMVEGLGNPFDPTSFKGRILRMIMTSLYKKALKHNKLVIFLNNDDEQEFINRKIVKKEQTLVIPGIGIDTNNIALSNNYIKENKVMMLSRLTKNKGIIDFCEIAELVKKERPDITFELYGNEQDVTIKDLEKYIKDGIINYYGYTNNPIETITKTKIYVSTSFYREGFPRTLLEAMALAKPIIATDTVGSKDAIKDGINGYLLHKHDINAFANKILEIIDDEKELKRIGESARKYCKEHFDSDMINDIILKEIEKRTN